MTPTPSNEDRQRQYQTDRSQREMISALNDSRSEMKRIELSISEFGAALGAAFKSVKHVEDTLNTGLKDSNKLKITDTKSFLSASVLRNLGKEIAKQISLSSKSNGTVSLAQAITNLQNTRALSERNSIDKLRYGKGSLSDLEKQVISIGFILF